DIRCLAWYRSHITGEWSAGRHEVDQCDGTVGSRKLGLKDQCIREVAPLDLCRRIHRRYAPSPVLGIAEQRGEAGSAVEPGPAEPIDRAVAGYQRRRFAVADQGIILDGVRHCRSL